MNNKSERTFFTIAGQTIGFSTCFIIAEAGVNHNGDLKKALALIDIAVDARADAVKFQTFKAENLVVKTTPKAGYQKQTTDPFESQFEMLKRLELSEEMHKHLKSYAEKKGILFLSTPFDEESANLLEKLDVAAYKISSGELTNLPFLEFIAAKKRPMIVSTGMANLDEVRAAVEVIEKTGFKDFALMHCTSNYPAEPSTVNLRAIQTLEKAFGKPVGYSDHTANQDVALAAVALGACIIEKHFTLDRNLPGPDHKASLEPKELISLIRKIRMIESAMGNGIKLPTESELEIASVARKSLISACTIKAGTQITSEMLVVKRPGTGLSPALFKSIVGRKAKNDIPEETPISFEMLL